MVWLSKKAVAITACVAFLCLISTLILCLTGESKLAVFTERLLRNPSDLLGSRLFLLHHLQCPGNFRISCHIRCSDHDSDCAIIQGEEENKPDGAPRICT
ncbi:uncharacterized protein [Cherax quadricarinatus]|uniref:uncharacterized protein isoform X3 n=1 Tax=Cherax quadricarinatus TaxID=27406 RepID=UPI00387EE240